MKHLFKTTGLILISFMLLFTSCRTEDTEFEQAPEEEILKANSAVAILMKKTATNDGSNDNIIDQSNCFNIQLPVTVTVNGIDITVTSETDFNDIETILDQFDNDVDTVDIHFPITVILSDYTEFVITDFDALTVLSNTCNGENEIDDDIECIDFQYPLTASVFNLNNELIETVIMNNDHNLHDFIEDLNDGIIVNMEFPITMILFDSSTLQINNFVELATAINDHKDDCDEDDDNDYNDDDCDNCTSSQIDSILTDCSVWTVDKLEINDNNLEDTYIGFAFSFLGDGTVNITSSSDTFPGTWETIGSGNSTTITINIPLLPDFNNTWNVHEIEQSSSNNKVDLRLGDDRLRFESDCN